MKINNIIQEEINKFINNTILEYHGDRKLPFDDEYYSNRNMSEEFLDWILEFGNRGSIGSSSITFNEGIKSKYNESFEWYINNGLGKNIEDFNEALNDYNFCDIDNNCSTDCEFDSRGNMYIERAVTLKNELSEPSEGEFNNLVKDYQNNVGGCWSWDKGKGESYCTENSGDTILLKGFIRLDDIDWLETIYINSYSMNDECEVRVKPNSKIEIFDIVSYNIDTVDGKKIKEYHFPLKGKIIASATYFGNNEKYNGDYARIYDSSDKNNKKFIDRKGNIFNEKEFTQDIQSKIDSGADINQLFDKVTTANKHSFYLIKLFNKYNVLFKNKILSNVWFDYISHNHNGFFSVKKNDKFNFISEDGKLLSDIWFDVVGRFSKNYALVEIYELGCNLLHKNGDLLFDDWFNGIFRFNENTLLIRRKNKNNILSINNDSYTLLSDKWFDNFTEVEDGIIVTYDDNNKKLIKI